MGVMPSSRHHDLAEQPHALRFAAYERTAAPGTAMSQGSPTHQAYSAGSPSGSPVKGQALHWLLKTQANTGWPWYT